MEWRSKTIAEDGLFVALALVASYVETLVPLHFAVPGVKLGLANGVVMFLLYKKGGKDAAIVSVIRIVLASFLFSGIFTMIYSLAGAFLSLLGMILLKKSQRFSAVGVSVTGGILHNVGQIMVAIMVLENENILAYLPVLAISGVVSGVVIGVITSILIKRTAFAS